MSCGEKETHNNYFVPIDRSLADACLKAAIKQGARIVVPLKESECEVVNEGKIKVNVDRKE
jgi:hypothetical protein